MTATEAGSSGQGTVELAILLPVLMILLLTVVQVALVARDHVAVHHAVREVARRASVEPNGLDPTDAARSTDLDPERMAVEFEGGRSTGDLLTVNLGYRSATEVPIVGVFVDDIDLSASAVVRVE